MQRAALLVVVLSLSWPQASVQASTLAETLCNPPLPPAGTLQYEIDLADKKIVGRRRFQPSDQVQIDLVNKNPFRFDYNIKIEEKAIPEPALDTFFKVFSTSPTASLLAAAKAARDLSDPGNSPSCSNGLSVLDDLRTQYARLQTLAARLTELFKKLDGDAGLQRLQSDQPCAELVAAAAASRDLIQAALDPSRPEGIGAALKAFQEGLKTYRTAIEKSPSISDFKAGIASCSPKVQANAVQELEMLLASVDARNDKGLAKLALDFEAAAKEAKATADKISDLLKSPQNFYEIRFVGDYDTPTQVTVKVDRKEKSSAADFSPYLETKLRFGGRQRFALAAGAAFGRVGQTTYKAIQGFELNADGSPVTGSDGKPSQTRVVGVDESSDWRATPLIILHARFAEGRGLISGYHFSFGFAGNTANNGLNLEYLVGPSISFAEERFFLTLGGYTGRTEKLQKGFYVGRGLPSAITDVPVTRGREWGLGLAVSVRFQ